MNLARPNFRLGHSRSPAPRKSISIPVQDGKRLASEVNTDGKVHRKAPH